MDQPGDQGDSSPSRVSSQTLICCGSKITSPDPRKTNQDIRSPVALSVVMRPGERGLVAPSGRAVGRPSSVTTALSVRGSPAATVRNDWPSTLRAGASLASDSGVAPAAPAAP